MSVLLDLAARVEAASGADRTLDADIWMALGLAPAGAEHEGYCPGWVKAPSIAFGCDKSPAFTASLDAAMTLVPEAPRKSIEQQTFKSGAPGEPERSWARISLMFAPNTLSADGEGRGATPALALTAAALRARDRGSKPDRATTAKTGVVHESPGGEANRPTSLPTITAPGRRG